MHFGSLEDDREDSTAPRNTFGPQMGGHRQCGLAICAFHLGFSLEGPSPIKSAGLPFRLADSLPPRFRPGVFPFRRKDAWDIGL